MVVCLHRLGAESTPVTVGRVHWTFHGTQGKHRKPQILFYGHYDIISAPRDGWD
ncbi:hypothetical protein HD554DRAFT_2099928 [Boletus coccyginus]|nr:hypothetical protein HD554DRAFT_2099928 [Boletus coccyginus]